VGEPYKDNDVLEEELCKAQHDKSYPAGVKEVIDRLKSELFPFCEVSDKAENHKTVLTLKDYRLLVRRIKQELEKGDK